MFRRLLASLSRGPPRDLTRGEIEEYIEKAIDCMSRHLYYSLRKTLMRLNTHVDAIYSSGNRTLLIHAIVMGDDQAVDVLLDCGANVNLVLHNAYPIQIAVMYNRCNIVSMLIASGSRIRFDDSLARLLEIKTKDTTDRGMVLTLINAGADLTNNEGLRLIDPYIHEKDELTIKIIDAAIQKGLDPCLVSQKNTCTLVQYLYRHGNILGVEHLYRIIDQDRMATLSSTGSCNMHFAVIGGDIDCIRFELSKNPHYAEHRNANGRLPIDCIDDAKIAALPPDIVAALRGKKSADNTK